MQRQVVRAARVAGGVGQVARGVVALVAEEQPAGVRDGEVEAGVADEQPRLAGDGSDPSGRWSRPWMTGLRLAI